jgi:hypothetical protein
MRAREDSSCPPAGSHHPGLDDFGLTRFAPALGSCPGLAPRGTSCPRSPYSHGRFARHGCGCGAPRHQLPSRPAPGTWPGRHARWSLCGLLSPSLGSAGATIVLGADETVERRSGRKSTAKGCYRESVCSAENHGIRGFGLTWVAMRLLVPGPPLAAGAPPGAGEACRAGRSARILPGNRGGGLERGKRKQLGVFSHTVLRSTPRCRRWRFALSSSVIPTGRCA